MAKRFTDTTLYDKAWFRKLPPRMKCAWDWLCKRCDVIGIWNIDMDKLSFEVGEPVTLEDLERVFKVKVFEEDKLFLPTFVPFQYGDESGRLSPKNKFHLSIAEKLEARGLPRPDFKPLPAPLADPIGMGVDTPEGVLGTPQGRGQGKGQGQGKEKGGVGENKTPPPKPQPVTPENVKACGEAWIATLGKFKIPRKRLTPAEELEISRAIQRWGAEAVELALYGARFEPKTETFDPKEHASLGRIFDRDRNGKWRFDKFLNWGVRGMHQEHPHEEISITEVEDGDLPPADPEKVRALLASYGFGKDMKRDNSTPTNPRGVQR